LIVGQPMGN